MTPPTMFFFQKFQFLQSCQNIGPTGRQKVQFHLYFFIGMNNDLIKQVFAEQFVIRILLCDHF